jgi:hypothetical protein
MNVAATNRAPSTWELYKGWFLGLFLIVIVLAVGAGFWFHFHP